MVDGLILPAPSAPRCALGVRVVRVAAALLAGAPRPAKLL